MCMGGLIVSVHNNSVIRTQKKLKTFDDSGMNNLDCTTPVKNILDELYIKNPKAHRFYCQVLGRRPSSQRGVHCCMVGHNVAAFPSEWDGELPDYYNETFTYKGNLPRMLLPPRHLTEKDQLSELLAVKSDWTERYQRMVGAVRYTKDLVEYTRLTEEVARCSQHYVNMAAHVQCEPEPRFKSHFNWHYAGRGNLCHVSFYDKSYLLHSELTCLSVSAICEDDTTPNLEESITFDCGENHFIQETTWSAQYSLIALRTVNKVFLLKLNQDLTFDVKKTLESKVVYTSVEFDPHHAVLYVADLDDTVAIVNINTFQCKRVVLNQKPKYVDNWNTVQGIDRLHYAHVTTTALNIFRKKTHTRVYSIKNINKKFCDDCNVITVIRHSEQLPHRFYFGTNHQLFCVDLRYNKNTKPKLIMRWTHGMRCPPTYISVNNFEIGKEVILLSSQWPEDTTVIVNDVAHLKAGLPPNTMYLPFKPPNIFDSLDRARTKKLCLDPTLPIDKRICTALTGLYVRECDDKFDVFIQNSLGDITIQSLYPQHLQDIVPMEFSKELNLWSNSLKLAPEKLNANEIFNISAFWAFKDSSSPREPKFLKEKNKVNFTEESLLELFESEDFDDDLLPVWNLEESM